MHRSCSQHMPGQKAADMSDWQRSLEAMASSLDGLRQRFQSFNPAREARSDQGYVQASITFRGGVTFDFDPTAFDPEENVNVESEVVEAYNRAHAAIAEATQSGISDLLPGLTKSQEGQ